MIHECAGGSRSFHGQTKSIGAEGVLGVAREFCVALQPLGGIKVEVNDLGFGE